MGLCVHELKGGSPTSPVGLEHNKAGGISMTLLLIGLAILIVGGWAYGKFCEKLFGPDERATPAYTKADGVDYVPMKTWKNTLINLLS
jgi:carbon starvation protein CstA